MLGTGDKKRLQKPKSSLVCSGRSYRHPLLLVESVRKLDIAMAFCKDWTPRRRKFGRPLNLALQGFLASGLWLLFGHGFTDVYDHANASREPL